MRDQQIIREANATEDGNKCQRRRGQLRQQTNLMGGTNMRGESELSMEGMRFGLGWVMWDGSDGVGNGRKGVGSGTERGK